MDCEVYPPNNTSKLGVDRRSAMKRDQQIYRPGSGPLKKSLSPRIDEAHEAHSQGSNNRHFDDEARDSNGRRNRKPEQQLYVCPSAANARDQDYDLPSNGNDAGNGSISKKYPRRRGGNDNDFRRHGQGQGGGGRMMRQGSEPRGGPSTTTNGTSWSRQRDTRSVEPTNHPPRQQYQPPNNSDRQIQAKPPSGRRHSTIGVESDRRHKPNTYDIPPRFRKKNEENNKVPQVTPSASGDHWNGRTMTFQVSSKTTEYPKIPEQSSIPSIFSVNTNFSENIGYSTLPGTKSRGRGRLSQLENEGVVGHVRYNSSSRPGTPVNDRPRTPELKSLQLNQRVSVFDRLGSKEAQRNERRSEEVRVNERRSEERQNERRSDDVRVNERRSEDRQNERRSDDVRQNERRYEDNFNDRRFNRRNYNNQSRAKRDSFRRDRNANRHDDESTRFNERSRVASSPVRREVSPPRTQPTKPDPVDILIEETKISLSLDYSTNFDWSEDVELNYRLENDGLSDAMTRSSSVTSLVDLSCKSMPASSATLPKKNRRYDNSRDRLTRQQSAEPDFKVPKSRSRRRRQSRDRRDSSFDRNHHSSRDCSFERNRNSSTSEHENWREEIRSRQNSERESQSRAGSTVPEHPTERTAGILVLPSNSPPKNLARNSPAPPTLSAKPTGQKSLFDHHNPNKPIIIPKERQSSRAHFEVNQNCQASCDQSQSGLYPSWYDEASPQFAASKYPNLLRDIRQADSQLQKIYGVEIFELEVHNRSFLKESLKYLLCNEIKFCQTEHVEEHFWKILYYNFIEMTRQAQTNEPEQAELHKKFLVALIEDGTEFFEKLLEVLEQTYDFKIDKFLGVNSSVKKRGLGNVGMALVSVQKLFLFLGDLERYRENIINMTGNFGTCRHWYIKAQEINPKNGKPYNQLAILAVHAKRKLDAVYYYMRCVMSSNPAPTARQNLIQLFDEIRKKYLQGEKKRREERLERQREKMKQKESENFNNGPNSLRKETWIHPGGGRRLHRTTQSLQDCQKDSEEEDLAGLRSVDVNKRFVVSYLHVHAKLVTKIGMESFHETAMQMLKEFRALIQHSPIPLPCNRFLQLLALNMYAIETTQLNAEQSQAGYCTEQEERALMVSLQMFNLILERCVPIMQEYVTLNPNGDLTNLPPDATVLLPPIKIWSDWLLAHNNIWNPPLSTQDYKVGSSGDAWSRLAHLMTILEQLDKQAPKCLVEEQLEGYELIRLPEDSVLSGFPPLAYTLQEETFAPKDLDIELAQATLRLRRLLFFGTTFLCGLQPPVLKLELGNGFPQYTSVVRTSSSSPTDSLPTPPELDGKNDVLLESFSEGEEEPVKQQLELNGTTSEVCDLLNRKNELERQRRHQELHLQQVKKILSQSVVSVHIEVRPKYLVPDTNCFIDHLDDITRLAAANCFTLMVPIVVLSELEGLARGGKTPMPSFRNSLDPQHVIRVGESAKLALVFLKSKQHSVKCITTRGAILTSTTFTTEDDSYLDSTFKNDDKILATCLALCKSPKDLEGPNTSSEGPRQLVREVVLLTDDRNLRVKAYARDVPVRELPDFMGWWMGLG